ALIVSAVPATGGGVAAYEPIVSMPNVGVTADVVPIQVPGTNTAMLTVHSSITRWTPQRGSAVVSAAWGPGSFVDAGALQSPVSPSTPAASSRPMRGRMEISPGTAAMGSGFFEVPAEDPKPSPAGALHAVGASGGMPTQPTTANPQTALT